MTDRIRHAVILAAGRGQRMMPLTETMPKAMAPYNGSTLIAQGIEQIGRHIANVHITVGYRGAMLAEHVIHHGARTVINTDGQTNSWWLYAGNTLLSGLDEPIFVLTCDNVIDLDFESLESDYFERGEPACMIVPVKPIDGLEGDYIFHKDHTVTRLSRTDESDIYCSGIQIVNPKKVQALLTEEGDFYSVWAQLIASGQLLISHIYPKRWISVDTIAQLQMIDGDPVS